MNISDISTAIIVITIPISSLGIQPKGLQPTTITVQLLKKNAFHYLQNRVFPQVNLCRTCFYYTHTHTLTYTHTHTPIFVALHCSLYDQNPLQAI